MNSRFPDKTDLQNIAYQIREGIRSGKYTLNELQMAVMDRSKEMARSTDYYVHEHAWKVAAAAVTVGLLVGFIFTNRRW